ncbi:MAG: BatA domain-containing protein, partial [Acidobacteria bacterium]|nr:BatA domain-containing protein [Acidobacteriota bacterium]
MSVFWLQPQAWWGVAALAIPIAIHLLARQRSRRLLFPTLRFLRATRLAALRQHVVS